MLKWVYGFKHTVYFLKYFWLTYPNRQGMHLFNNQHCNICA